MKKHTPLNESREVLEEMAATIAATFQEFNAPIEIVEAIEGYSHYHFFLRPKKAMRMKAFASYVDDLKYALSNDDVEIEAPVPNKKLVGIIVSKKVDLPQIPFADAIKWEEFARSTALTVPIGIDEFGGHHLINIARLPHLLIAGCTGSGKSVLLHSFINALIEKNTPEQLRFIFIDPKRIELTMYEGLPHLLTKPLTESKKALKALAWAIKEMERRYDILQAEGVQNISTYHENVHKPAVKEWEKKGARIKDKGDLPEALPYIIIVIDELNDFMQTYPREFETCIVRLAQMSRAVGIHLIISTQRPSVNVITGTIKANIPSRIALTVASQVDSRTILDQAGAEKLRGSGDLLLLIAEDPKLHRIQSLHISDAEVAKRVEAYKRQNETNSDTLDLDTTYGDDRNQSFMEGISNDEASEDELYEDAKQAVMEAGKASTSYLQRKLRIGYSRAARLMDLLEECGVIGQANGAEPRQIN